MKALLWIIMVALIGEGYFAYQRASDQADDIDYLRGEMEHQIQDLRGEIDELKRQKDARLR